VQTAAADFHGAVRSTDIVIANAGVSAGTLTEISEDLSAFRRIMDTNVFGMAVTFTRSLRRCGRKRAARWSESPASGRLSRPARGSAYSASKSAAITYLESLRVELYGSGVAVVTICPGYIRTPMTAANRYRMPFIIGRGRGGPAVRARHRGKNAALRSSPGRWRSFRSCFAVCSRWLFDRFVRQRAAEGARSPPVDGAESETRRRCGHAARAGARRCAHRESRAEH